MKALLFDLDGTLVDTDPIHYRAWFEGLEQHGVTLDESMYKSKISGRLNPDIVQDLLPQLSLAAGEEFVDRKEARFRELAQDELTPLPGLRDILEWSETQNLRRALVSNAPRANAQFVLEVLQLQETFEFVVLGEDVARAKPDPLPYQTALEKLKVSAPAAIAFEDSLAGMRSAVGAGLRTVGITTTQDPKDLRAIGAAITVSNFMDVELWTWLQTVTGISAAAMI